jgi:hypothetical protein
MGLIKRLITTIAMPADWEPALWGVVSAKGRRIEVRRDFDGETLARLIRAREEI